MISREAPPDSAPAPEPVMTPPQVTIPLPEAPKSSRRKMVAIALIVIIAGAVGFGLVYTQTSLFRHPSSASSTSPQPNTNYNTFSNYGYSFQYPKTWTINERGLLNNTADANSGIVIAQNPASQGDSIFVAWVHSATVVDPSAAVPAAIGGFQRGSGGTGLSTGQLQTTTTRAGYSVDFETFSVTISGTQVNGVWAAWYSTSGQRLYQLGVTTSDQSAMTMFNTALSSFAEQ